MLLEDNEVVDKSYKVDCGFTPLSRRLFHFSPKSATFASSKVQYKSNPGRCKSKNVLSVLGYQMKYQCRSV